MRILTHNIVAVIWIILGVYWFINPRALRRSFARKSLHKLRWTFILIAFVVGSYLIGISWKIPGLASKVIFSIGIVVVLRGLFYIQGRVFMQAVRFWEKYPDDFYRLPAFVFLITGIILFFVG